MSETEPQDRPNATEADEVAEFAAAAEAGDDVIDLALEEAGGPDPRQEEETPAESALPAVSQEAADEPPAPEEGLVDRPDSYVVHEAAEEEAVEEEAPEEEAVALGALESQALEEAALEEAAPEEAPAEPAEAEGGPEPVKAEVKPPAASARAKAEPEEPAEAMPASPFDPPGEWYVVHTYAGYENKVKTNLHSRIGSMQMEDKIFDVVIPMEDVMEIKGGKKQVVQRKVFPGYLLVKMIYDNDSWYVVRNTPGVTGFVASGTGTKPTPLSRREVEKILAVKQETQKKPEYRLEWEEGDVVRIIAGPFADFQGTIDEINVEQSKLKVLVNIFDRETPVELAFDQVAKA
jgi:transcriptional antiterminator NusG